MEGFTIISCTRNRSYTFSLLERWMQRQTHFPHQWIVVNDGAEPYRYSMGAAVINRDPVEERELRIGPVLHSLNHNLLAAIDHGIAYDKVCFFEDDDWYHPEYLWRLDAELHTCPLVGVSPMRYYNLELCQAALFPNQRDASLAATAFRREVLETFVAQVKRGDPFVDYNLWGAWKGERRLIANVASDGRALQVGLKGTGTMGGRQVGSAGVGAGHRDMLQSFGLSDPAARHLREWVGDEDADCYLCPS